MTPRTVKASEVRKGMRVRVTKDVPADGPLQAHTLTYEGEIRRTDHGTGCDTFAGWYWADGDGEAWACYDPDHPVTVLADPEPEWVEGAWYWTSACGRQRAMRRTPTGGWCPYLQGGWEYRDDEVTVLGRVLIVDWPGDDVAREVAESAHWYHVKDDGMVALHTALADAIRTQGSVR